MTPALVNLWLESAALLAAAVAMIVGLCGLAAWRCRAAAWRRSIWQTAALAVLAIGILEICGAGRLLPRWALAPPSRPAKVSEATELATSAGPSTPRPEAPAAVLPPLGLEAAPPLWTSPAWLPRAAVEYQPTWHSDFLLLAPIEVWPSLHEEIGAAASPASPAVEDSASEPQPASVPAAAPLASHTQAAAPPAGWLPVVWLAGTLVVLAGLGWGRVRRGFFLRQCMEVADDGLRARVKRLAGRLRLGRPVRLLAHARLAGPAAFGLWRPTLLLPTTFAREAPPARQEAILAHELAHLAGHDSLWLGLSGLACAVLWWHPLTWVMRRSLRTACEHVADEASLLVPDGPAELADGLVQLARRLVCKPRVAGLAVEGDGLRSQLGRRVERLLRLTADTAPPPASRAAALQIGLPVVLVMVVLFGTAWARTPAISPQGGSTMSALSTAWRSSLAAAACSALMGAGGDVATEGVTPQPRAAAVTALAANDDVKPRADAGFDIEVELDDRGEARLRGDELRLRIEQRVKEEHERMARHREELEQMARELRGKLEDLPEERENDRRALREKLERVMNELREGRPPREGDRGGPPPEARRDGPPRERERLGPPPEGRRDGPPREEWRATQRVWNWGVQHPHADAIRKLTHLRVAEENLRLAGLDQEAKEIAERANRIQEELKKADVTLPDVMLGATMALPPSVPYILPAPQPSPYAPPGYKPLLPPNTSYAPAAAGVPELRKQVDEMRDEMRAIRRALERLSAGRGEEEDEEEVDNDDREEGGWSARPVDDDDEEEARADEDDDEDDDRDEEDEEQQEEEDEEEDN